MPLNPNAAGFSFNPGAGSFVPVSAPKPEPVVEEIVLPSPPAEAPPSGEEEEDEIDESDPLWKVFLKIAGGDKAKAQSMLLEPDEFMELPEVIAALEGGGDDAWDADAPLAPAGGAAEEPAAASKPPPAPSAASSGGGGGAAVADDDEEAEGAVVEVEEVEADPREHLNLVFIGHVDAGKSTLSGNILYLTVSVGVASSQVSSQETRWRGIVVDRTYVCGLGDRGGGGGSLQ